MARRRKNPFKKFFFGGRGFKLWPIIIIFTALYYLGINPFSTSSAQNIEYYSAELFSFIILLFLLFSFIGVFYFIFLVVNKSPITQSNIKKSDFTNSPGKYSKSIIQFSARVEVYFPDPFNIRIKKFGVHLFRNLTKQDNHIGRYYHQRFLISSPILKEGERIIVLHNTKYGWLKLNSGDWIQLRGEYLHNENTNSKNDGRKVHFYGKIHYTHDPLGFIKKLSRSQAKKDLAENGFLEIPSNLA